MKIPPDALSGEALAAVIESFVLREGTDYGREYTLESKCAQVRRALMAGTAELFYDPVTETIDIRPTDG
jgi:uncharacterized protein YheU (UPF0270 family)